MCIYILQYYFVFYIKNMHYGSNDLYQRADLHDNGPLFPAAAGVDDTMTTKTVLELCNPVRFVLGILK